jgi:DNA-binding IclR family transcriptional regulator
MMRGVVRTVAVFDCFTPQRLRLTLQEIADGIALPKSTTFRIVQSLEQTGYLVRLEDQKYCLSFRFTRLAGMVISTLSIRQVARPLIIELAHQTGETVTINMVNGRDRVCIEAVDTPSPLMSMARPGQLVRLDGKGATAKTLMAHLPEKERAKLLGQLAKASGRKPAQVLGELARVKKDGYCVSHGEHVLGLSAIAAPIWEINDTVTYCVTITAPTVRLTPKVDAYAKLLLKTSIDISRRLGADSVPATLQSPTARARKPVRRRRAGLGAGASSQE